MIEFLLYLVIIIVIVILIFKIIKKLVYAVLTVIFFFILLFAGVGGLIYADYNYITDNQDVLFKVVYEKNGEYLFGVDIPVKNSTIDNSQIKGISDLSRISKKIESEQKTFLIILDSQLFEKLILNRTFSLAETLELPSDFNLDLTFEGSELLKIIESSTPEQEVSNLLLGESSIAPILNLMGDDFLANLISSETLGIDLSINELLFLFILTQSIEDQRNMVLLIEGFKEEELEIYPNRFVFRLLELLPTKTILGFLE